MKIIIAKYAGFCFGVKRAVKTAYKYTSLNDIKKTYTYGELIHNHQVVEDLKNKGIDYIDNIGGLTKNDRVIIRTHGVSKSVYENILSKNVDVIDMTCPFVKKVQKIASDYYKKNYKIIIIGDKNHPEVIGVNGWCENTAIIVNSVNDAKIIPIIDKACVVAQTTITQDMWNNILKELYKKVKELISFNTICDATNKRQSAALEIAKKADIMIVIGGINSSNTQKLKHICEAYCKTIHIESSADINSNLLKGANIIGITAGASTPDYIINDVIEKISKVGKEE